MILYDYLADRNKKNSGMFTITNGIKNAGSSCCQEASLFLKTAAKIPFKADPVTICITPARTYIIKLPKQP